MKKKLLSSKKNRSAEKHMKANTRDKTVIKIQICL